jgi:hypothetical protein
MPFAFGQPSNNCQLRGCVGGGLKIPTTDVGINQNPLQRERSNGQTAELLEALHQPSRCGVGRRNSQKKRIT